MKGYKLHFQDGTNLETWVQSFSMLQLRVTSYEAHFGLLVKVEVLDD